MEAPGKPATLDPCFLECNAKRLLRRNTLRTSLLPKPTRDGHSLWKPQLATLRLGKPIHIVTGETGDATRWRSIARLLQRSQQILPQDPGSSCCDPKNMCFQFWMGLCAKGISLGPQNSDVVHWWCLPRIFSIWDSICTMSPSQPLRLWRHSLSNEVDLF